MISFEALVSTAPAAFSPQRSMAMLLASRVLAPRTVLDSRQIVLGDCLPLNRIRALREHGIPTPEAEQPA